MNAISEKTLDVITDAGKEAVSLVINKTTGDNHPEYERAVISGTSEAIKELAKSDTQTAVRIYQNIKIKREQRDFFNFSKIIHKFASLVKISPKEKITDDNDFFWNIIEHSKEISNEEMQDLIAKILASEYNKPRSYSMHTLQIIKSTDSKILNDFTKVLSLTLINSGIFRDIFADSETIRSLGVDYLDFLNLQNIGLVSSNDSSIKSDGEIQDIYLNRLIRFVPKDKENKNINFPNFYSLTKAGREIAQHLSIKENPNFLDWLKKKYENRNFTIEV